MAHLTFVSHASEDSAYAEKLVADLEARGAHCWYAPRDLPVGTDFAQAIYEAISCSDNFLVLISVAADRSEHVAREIGLAAQMRCPIVPMRIDDHTPTGALCYYSRTINMHTLTGDGYGTAIDRLGGILR